MIYVEQNVVNRNVAQQVWALPGRESCAISSSTGYGIYFISRLSVAALFSELDAKTQSAFSLSNDASTACPLVYTQSQHYNALHAILQYIYMQIYAHRILAYHEKTCFNRAHLKPTTLSFLRDDQALFG